MEQVSNFMADTTFLVNTIILNKNFHSDLNSKPWTLLFVFYFFFYTLNNFTDFILFWIK